jgi:type II secretory pathway pseudopilin PulG
MPAACCRRSAVQGLTLVEVIAGLVLMATLLAGILVSFGNQAAQMRKSRDRLKAVELADRLLGDWSAQNAIPAIGTEQTLEGTKDWRWRLAEANSTDLDTVGLAAVRLEVFRRIVGTPDQVLASVDLLVPGRRGAPH